MESYPPTIIIRHRKENLKKCSLRGLEKRQDITFLTYPEPSLPSLDDYFLLSIDGPPLTDADSHLGLLLLDGTWRYAAKMLSQIKELSSLPRRSIPPGFVTAYPRRQEDCPDPSQGLASVEALFIAYHLLRRDTKGLLGNYHWEEQFLKLNPQLRP
ncbi:MAG: DTW domain-containing protein [Chlamydiota bacterium]